MLVAMLHPGSAQEVAFVRVVLFQFLFEELINIFVEIFLHSCEYSGIVICSYRKLSDQEHADEILPLSEDPSMVKISVDRLNDGTGMCRVPLGNSESQMIFRD